MKRNKEFMKRMVWLSLGLFATVHFLTADVGIAEHIVPNMKIDLEGYISEPMPWKSIVSVFIPFDIG
jgi:hypothetical protein